MKRLLRLALAASLPACTTTGTTMTDRLAAASPRIEALQATYDAAKRFSANWLPYLPPAQRAYVETAGAAVEQALALARTASTVAAQQAAIREAEAAAHQFAHVTGN